MNKEFKIYHTETQEDYDDLMVKLENEGCLWASGDKPTSEDYWTEHTDETVIYVDSWEEGEMTRGYFSETKSLYPTTPIIKHKAKGAKQMEKVVVPQFVADWFELMEGHSLGVKLEELYLLGSEYGEWFSWMSGLETEDKSGYGVAEEIVAKMHIYGYEVEEEKKYYWRKKREYLLDCEIEDYTYLNIEKDTGDIYFSDEGDLGIYQTLLTETQVRQAVGGEDFNKLERVEADEQTDDN